MNGIDFRNPEEVERKLTECLVDFGLKYQAASAERVPLPKLIRNVAVLGYLEGFMQCFQFFAELDAPGAGDALGPAVNSAFRRAHPIVAAEARDDPA